MKAFSWSYTTYACSPFGPVNLAAHQIALNIFCIFAIFGDAVSQISQTYLPQFFGSSQTTRAMYEDGKSIIKNIMKISLSLASFNSVFAFLSVSKYGQKVSDVTWCDVMLRWYFMRVHHSNSFPALIVQSTSQVVYNYISTQMKLLGWFLICPAVWYSVWFVLLVRNVRTVRLFSYSQNLLKWMLVWRASSYTSLQLYFPTQSWQVRNLYCLETGFVNWIETLLVQLVHVSYVDPSLCRRCL